MARRQSGKQRILVTKYTRFFDRLRAFVSAKADGSRQRLQKFHRRGRDAFKTLAEDFMSEEGQFVWGLSGWSKIRMNEITNDRHYSAQMSQTQAKTRAQRKFDGTVLDCAENSRNRTVALRPLDENIRQIWRKQKAQSEAPQGDCDNANSATANSETRRDPISKSSPTDSDDNYVPSADETEDSEELNGGRSDVNENGNFVNTSTSVNTYYREQRTTTSTRQRRSAVNRVALAQPPSALSRGRRRLPSGRRAQQPRRPSHLSTSQ
ncbi:MAG: hypothetical protein Q9227_008475 [Pyrenula ochraceoflavens]